MKAKLSAFASGLVFASGLALSGMTLPSKVIGFLDVTGAWDPTLALVMAAALGVLFATRGLAPKKPILAESFSSNGNDGITFRLVAGAAIFGAGWGLSGFCPGPAVVSLGAGSFEALLFVPAMLIGMRVGQRAQFTAPRSTVY